MNIIQQRNVGQEECGLMSESGHALPSVLFIVVLLSILASSLIIIQYLNRRLAVLELARVKAGYASENAFQRFFAEEHESDAFEADSVRREYQFSDGSVGSLSVSRWGGFLFARATGTASHVVACRYAFLAAVPPGIFANAFVLGNIDHQLIMTGISHIDGDVVVGRQGVSIGNLAGRSTPMKLPINGNIIKEGHTMLPSFRALAIEAELRAAKNVCAIENNGKSQRKYSVDDIGLVSDSVPQLVLSGDQIMHGTMKRRDKPCSIIVRGNLTLDAPMAIHGLVRFVAAGSITIKKGVSIDGALLIALDSVRVTDGASLCGQIMSPAIIVESNSRLEYPSAIFSCGFDSASEAHQRIEMKGNARLEGTVGYLSRQIETMQMPARVSVGTEALIIGSVYSEGNVLLDGTVYGSALLKDLNFYESPTTYVGWLRNGGVERTKLPPGYLVPLGFSGSSVIRLLDWI